MIHNLWKCFETTGDINTYLSFKEYEKLQGTSNNVGEAEMDDGLITDGMSE